MPKINYDLEERTAKFGTEVINLAKSIPQNSITSSIISQLIRSATSIGANYCEADDAESAKDFIHKLGICKKEAHETKHWLRMLVGAYPGGKESASKLWQEVKELHLIFNSIINKTKSKF
ncbi:TPA: four helix bundle protein [Patescibacteria group bacterium]|uniref:Four helix bundle protein n=1 Tax=Candidatus Nomurabacteria bacterium RIFCSPHIGHO2_02_FULL_38_15 TaxID=1801752 RepID=A0A1F6VPX0_9BACT|nr:MAG: four helix bundle protein [Candidatus Nomurabacteria bacterium RIFCSPHIGHO2_02_FULL_38_15]HBV33571.1 four helix bundle protein [Patescibacteria group bacterium]HCU47476.1 four helix bundle protein [Patescibacteria group bacterium]